MTPPKASRFQAVVLVSTVGLAYLWLQTPLLSQYALQIFAATVLVFFVIKRLKKAKLWYVLPENMSVEMALVTFAFMLLIGATGNMDSHFYALTYVHLFLLALTTRVSTAISTTIAVMIFHFMLTPNLNLSELSSVLVLPLLLTFFLFAKRQYDEVQTEKALLAKETALAENFSHAEHNLENFITEFLKPKLQQLQSLAAKEATSTKELATQISLLESEADKVLKQVRSTLSAATETPPTKP